MQLFLFELSAALRTANFAPILLGPLYSTTPRKGAFWGSVGGAAGSVSEELHLVLVEMLVRFPEFLKWFLQWKQAVNVNEGLSAVSAQGAKEKT